MGVLYTVDGMGGAKLTGGGMEDITGVTYSILLKL